LTVLEAAVAVDGLARLEPGGCVVGALPPRPVPARAVRVVGALRKVVARGPVPEARAAEALAQLDVPLLERMWQLRAKVSAGDAAFVALAKALAAELVTTDERLARAPGHSARIVAP
jgi:predicted nucleic acid-binding protein